MKYRWTRQRLAVGSCAGAWSQAEVSPRHGCREGQEAQLRRRVLAALDSGCSGDAIRALARLELGSAPPDPALRAQRAALLLAAQRWVDAENVLRQLLMDPAIRRDLDRAGAAAAALACSLFHQGRALEAAAAARAAAVASPSLAEYLQGDRSTCPPGLPLLAEASRLSPGFTAWLRRGDVRSTATASRQLPAAPSSGRSTARNRWCDCILASLQIPSTGARHVQ